MKIERQYIHFSDDSDGWQCLVGTEVNDDIKTEGHDYVAVVAFKDKGTDRWYSVLKCERCNHPSVSWTDSESDANEMKAGFIYQEVGG